MEPSFLNQSSNLGRVFEIAVQRGVLEWLIHEGLLDGQHQVLEPWRKARNSDIYTRLIQALDLSDPYAQDWAKTAVRHLLVLGYGLGWTAIRECLGHSALRKPRLEAIWCPLVLPGVEIQRDEEVEATAQAFQSTFDLPGHCDLGWVRQGQPARADFLLWLSSGRQNSRQREEREKRKEGKTAKANHAIFCLEFSYNAPGKLADFRSEEAHREEISRYARYLDSRGVFSRICAEVSEDEFLISSNLANHLVAFSGSDKPLYKLCQASSYTESLVRLLRAKERLHGVCNTRAIAVTSNGFESIAAQFTGNDPEPDPRTRLMASLGTAYCRMRKIGDDVSKEALNAEIRTVFNKLVRSLPREFKEQAKQLAQQPDINGSFQYLFKETLEHFHNPMQLVACDEAIAAVEETRELIEFFGGNSPKACITEAFQQQNPQNNQLPLRGIHAAAVIAGLRAAQVGQLNVLALEGNPGIGKTTAVTQFLKQQRNGYLFLYVSPRVVINRDVTTKFAQDKGEPSGILTVTTNSKLIAAAPQWYEEQRAKQGSENRVVDSAVVVDGVAGLAKPVCNTVFVTPDEEHQIDCNIVTSARFKRSRSEREDRVESSRRPGVLRTLAGAARRLLEENPKTNRLVMTAAIQGYRATARSTTVEGLGNLFSKKPNTPAGRRERQEFSKRISTIIVMVDELAGDGAGALFAHRLADWLQEQFIDPFEGSKSPFRLILIASDASLSNEVVLNSYLNSGERAPDKVLISPSGGNSPFRVTGTYRTHLTSLQSQIKVLKSLEPRYHAIFQQPH
ncbi:hypothetical protein NDI52_29655 [Leptolyngbya sp. PL-A3]|uniref:hypothetical protein n=1 Tax=Leptolyngbya sp. PL-A3 TaxID=2933911 RepID=UPI00329A6B71